MIPSDQATLDKMKALADRNIANGDWGDEVRMPDDDMPMTDTERSAKTKVSSILAKAGNLSLPKRKKS